MLLCVTLFYVRREYLVVNISCKILLIRVLKIIEINLTGLLRNSLTSMVNVKYSVGFV